ncbi:MAG: hypothetical protein JWO73_921 [Candidatus Taylorbacteria bacterium]|nr:hypothetical protein [Candidatus Taylorbacteria bacterium]
MKPYDLAWKGTTVKHKRELLAHSLLERHRLINEGKIKGGQLQLASTCVDIIGTATAALEETEGIINEEWQKLLDEALEISKEAVALAEETDRSEWSSSDFEVAGVIILSTTKDAEHALNLLKQGLSKAESEGNAGSKTLLLGQIVKALMAIGKADDIERALHDLHQSIEASSPLDPKVSGRAYRALAIGAKFLAIHYAKEAGSENQELKARNI